MNAILIAMITYYANLYGVEPKVAIAVAHVESSFNPKAVGKVNERGLFQLNPKSFPNLSINKLDDIELNIKYGVLNLAKSKRECLFKDQLTWLICYNRGVKGAKKVKNPYKDQYVVKVNMKINNLVYREKLDVKQHNLRINGPINKTIKICRKN